jgi:hypothetical protein
LRLRFFGRGITMTDRTRIGLFKQRRSAPSSARSRAQTIPAETSTWGGARPLSFLTSSLGLNQAS